MSQSPSEMDRYAGRRKLLVGIGVLALIALRIKGPSAKRRIISCAPPPERKAIRVLTQDGKLMEIDAGNAGTAGRKISDKELQEWVHKK